MAIHDSGSPLHDVDPTEILDEVADISMTRSTFVVNESETALHNLTDAPCTSCPPGAWTIEAEDLEVLSPR